MNMNVQKHYLEKGTEMKYLGNGYHDHQAQLDQECRAQGVKDRESWESSVIVVGAMVLAGMVLVGVWLAGR